MSSYVLFNVVAPGDWAVAGCILRREWRDMVRRELGPHMVMVILTMSEEAREARLQLRHQDSHREVSWLQVF